MAHFDLALRKVLRHEGVEFDAEGNPIPGKTGLVNHPDDPGGLTNYGVIQAVATQHGYRGPLNQIPYETVKEIYRLRYWLRMMGDAIADQDIAEEVFDTGVNCGIATSIRFLQRTLNALNARGTRFPDVAADGAMGSHTLNALNKAIGVAPWYRLCILRALDSLQCVRYIELCERGSKFESFLPGWIRARCGVAD